MRNRFTSSTRRAGGVSPLKRRALVRAGVGLILAYTTVAPTAHSENADEARKNTASNQAARALDPAAWGSDHVGQPIPEYATGDQCLFCHREKVGPTWGENRHQLTVRDVDERSPALAALKQSSGRIADEVKFVMGGQRRQRFLKPASAYGQLELLSVGWNPSRDEKPGELVAKANPHWDAKQFGASWAGCHATAVNSKEQAFSATSLDCYVCHGNVPAEHTDKTEFVYLSAARKDDARVVTSICAQCHVRNGKSKSSRLPYPNNFVAGDNLFRDFAVDFSDRAFEELSTADRHVLENVRDVVVSGNEALTCLNCHDVHGRSSKKHRLVSKGDYCLNCHFAERPKRDLKQITNHSTTCGY